MKYFILNALLLSTLFVSAQELEFTGNLIGLQNNTKVILSDLRSRPSGKRFHDTASVSDGVFKFKTVLPGAGTYALRVALIGQNPEHRKLYLDGGKVQLQGKRGELKKAKVSSDAPYMMDYILFTELMESQDVFARKKLLIDTSMMRMAETGSYDGLLKAPGLLDRMMKVEKEAKAKETELAKKWLVENPNSDINAYIIQTYLRSKINESPVKEAIIKLSPASRRSFPGIILTTTSR